MLLKTPAKDNHGRQYQVEIAKDRDGIDVVNFQGAPSGWSVKTLLGHTYHVLAIDFGQNWLCINIQDIVAELRSCVAPDDDAVRVRFNEDSLRVLQAFIDVLGKKVERGENCASTLVDLNDAVVAAISREIEPT